MHPCDIFHVSAFEQAGHLRKTLQEIEQKILVVKFKTDKSDLYDIEQSAIEKRKRTRMLKQTNIKKKKSNLSAFYVIHSQGRSKENAPRLTALMTHRKPK